MVLGIPELISGTSVRDTGPALWVMRLMRGKPLPEQETDKLHLLNLPSILFLNFPSPSFLISLFNLWSSGVGEGRAGTRGAVKQGVQRA